MGHVRGIGCACCLHLCVNPVSWIFPFLSLSALAEGHFLFLLSQWVLVSWLRQRVLRGLRRLWYVNNICITCVWTITYGREFAVCMEIAAGKGSLLIDRLQARRCVLVSQDVWVAGIIRLAGVCKLKKRKEGLVRSRNQVHKARCYSDVGLKDQNFFAFCFRLRLGWIRLG